MQQTIINEHPPMFDAIDEAFSVKNKPVIFSFGDRLFNPLGVPIPPELIAHEAVHGERQGTDMRRIRDWWKRYIDDTRFRLDEEILAHQAEYQHLVTHAARRRRRGALSHVAQNLANPLYNWGNLVDHRKAKRLISLPNNEPVRARNRG